MQGKGAQLSLWLQLPKPSCTRAHVPQQKQPRQWKTQALQLENSPHSLQLEKARMQQQKPSAAENK